MHKKIFAIIVLVALVCIFGYVHKSDTKQITCGNKQGDLLTENNACGRALNLKS